MNVEDLLQAFKITEEQARKLIELIEQTGTIYAGKPIDAVMEDANNILNGFGIEALRDENAWVDHYWQNTIALYVNLGDTYITTIVYDTENREFLITSWGDFYETWMAERER